VSCIIEGDDDNDLIDCHPLSSLLGWCCRGQVNVGCSASDVMVAISKGRDDSNDSIDNDQHAHFQLLQIGSSVTKMPSDAGMP